MKLPAITGLIERRILINYRADPDVLATQLPYPFRPQLYRGFGMVGVCLIRLRAIRPDGFPARFGLSSENAAHRVAVQWDEHGAVRNGVYIPRRDTNSRLNVALGGRLFPGRHHHAHFTVDESAGHFAIAVRDRAGCPSVSIHAAVTNSLPETSVFESLAAAADFFRAGSVGYSLRADLRHCEGLELRCHDWTLRPLRVEQLCVRAFDDAGPLSPGRCQFDSALLMQNVEHSWHDRAQLDVRSPREVPFFS